MQRPKICPDDRQGASGFLVYVNGALHKGATVLTPADKYRLISEWLARAHPVPQQAHTEWSRQGVALLPLGERFAAVRLTGELVHAAIGCTEPSAVAVAYRNGFRDPSSTTTAEPDPPTTHSSHGTPAWSGITARGHLACWARPTSAFPVSTVESHQAPIGYFAHATTAICAARRACATLSTPGSEHLSQTTRTDWPSRLHRARVIATQLTTHHSPFSSKEFFL